MKVIQAMYGLAVATVLLAVYFPVQGQKTKTLPVIGFLSPFSPASEAVKPTFESFPRGLSDLGWVPGKNVTVEYRRANKMVDCLNSRPSW